MIFSEKFYVIYWKQIKLILSRILYLPANCDITGNEQLTPSFLAKKGAMVTQRYKRASSFHFLRLITNLTFRNNFKSEAAETSKNKMWVILVENPNCVPEAPRKTAVAHFRLQVYLANTAGSVPDHSRNADIAVKRVTCFFFLTRYRILNAFIMAEYSK